MRSPRRATSAARPVTESSMAGSIPPEIVPTRFVNSVLDENDHGQNGFQIPV
jgi:hypothetical protein